MEIALTWRSTERILYILEKKCIKSFYRNLIMVKSPIQYLSGGRVQLSTKSRKTMNDETVSEDIMLFKRLNLMKKNRCEVCRNFHWTHYP
jgi:hypothetical protein